MRRQLVAASLLVLCVAVLIGYAYRAPPQPAAAPTAAMRTDEAKEAKEATEATAGVLPVVDPPTPQLGATPDRTDELDLDTLTLELNAANPERRAAAIVALADAPREQALSLLQDVFSIGDVQDGHLALGSLRALAIEQGDQDGAIREFLRVAVYHSGDQDLVLGAQYTLDAVLSVLEDAQ